MTAREDALRMTTAHRKGTYEQRFPRYAHNAAVEAKFATGRQHGAERGAHYARSAADNALKNGDEPAAVLYGEMAEALDDVALAQEDVAEIAMEIARHFGLEDTG
jgi:hypothetical protein